jgi:hypothetical protein
VPSLDSDTCVVHKDNRAISPSPIRLSAGLAISCAHSSFTSTPRSGPRSLACQLLQLLRNAHRAKNTRDGKHSLKQKVQVKAPLHSAHTQVGVSIGEVPQPKLKSTSKKFGLCRNHVVWYTTPLATRRPREYESSRSLTSNLPTLPTHLIQSVSSIIARNEASKTPRATTNNSLESDFFHTSAEVTTLARYELVIEPHLAI